MNLLAALLVLIALAGPAAASSLPLLNVGGYAWAENLVFDCQGNMFVSDHFQGTVTRIALNTTTNTYEKHVHAAGFDSVGGLSVSDDGQILYFSAKTQDGVFGVYRVRTTGTPHGPFTPLATLEALGNGVAVDDERNIMWTTAEHSFIRHTGTLTQVNLTSGETHTVKDDLYAADGLWFDKASKLLFVGQLLNRHIYVYDTVAGQGKGDFDGMQHGIALANMLDDLTLWNGTSADLGATLLVGADFTGKEVVKFRLDGSSTSVLSPPSGIDLHQPTSVRWGCGTGFDANSLYVSEGGGLSRMVTSRRVLQFPIGSADQERHVPIAHK